MYLEHFGFSELPFSLTPDPGYFFRYAEHQEALNVLLVALIFIGILMTASRSGILIFLLLYIYIKFSS